MIRIGDYNTLNVVRSTSVGIFLDDGEGTEILLPNKYVPENIKINQSLKVFCYLDHEERPVATTLTPKVIRDQFAHLEVAEVNKIGAFLNWGLEKQLLVPFKEQASKLEVGKRYIVHCYLDEQSFRLVASTKINKFLNKKAIEFNINDAVNLLFSRKTDLGWEVIIENSFKGLLFFSDVFEDLVIGDRCLGYIKSIREDGKIDVSLAPLGIKSLDTATNRILKELEANNGTLLLHDKSSPEEIKQVLQISKKAFKKGVGVLYKQRKIILTPQGIQLKK